MHVRILYLRIQYCTVCSDSAHAYAHVYCVRTCMQVIVKMHASQYLYIILCTYMHASNCVHACKSVYVHVYVHSHYYFVSFRILIMIPYSLLFGHNIYSVSKKERSIFGVDLKKTRTIGAFLRAGESMWPLDRRYSVDHASDPKCVPQFRTKSW